MNKIDKDYQNLLKDIMENGVEKNTRNGKTLSVFGRYIRHNMKDGYPLLTTKKMHFKSIVTELMWFLNGKTDIRYLLENNCHIWDGDAYKNWCNQFEVDSNNFNDEEVAKGYSDQCWGYPLLENTSKEYKRGQINAYLEGKADKPFFYLTQDEFINKINTDGVFAEKWSDFGPIYGKQWRSWDRCCDLLCSKHQPIDQIQNLINDLISNPDGRRLIVSAWNPSDLSDQLLPPCHNFFQLYTRELTYTERYKIWFGNNYETGLEYCEEVVPDFENEYYEPTPKRAISLMWNQRSVDTALGLPFNIASYALLLETIGKVVNMVPEELIGTLGDCHIYLNQIDGVKEQLTRDPFELPILNINTEFWPTEGGECGIGGLSNNINSILRIAEIADFTISDYNSHPSIKIPLSN
jgi:thymidylate synthase